MEAHGGKRPGAGRKPGGRNRATIKAGECTITDLARQHSGAALDTLAELMSSAESEAVRKAAADSILDRAWGKPPQQVQHTGEDGGAIMVRWMTSADD